jgi:transposase-like protein
MENNTVEKRQTKFKESLIMALKEMPIIEVAAKRVGVSRDTYYRWRREDKIFLRQAEDALNQGIEFINDMSESQLITLIKEKKMPAIAMWLKHNNPRYGSKKQLHTHIATAEELTPDEEKLVFEALRLVSGKKI